jgi:hypothetical protein
MRRLLMATAVGGTVLMTGYATAAAQVAVEVPGGGVYVGPAYRGDYYYGRPYYREYGYYDSDVYRSRRERRIDFQNCGRHAHWDGNTCQPGWRRLTR